MIEKFDDFEENHSIIAKKLNEIIDKLNQLEAK